MTATRTSEDTRADVASPVVRYGPTAEEHERGTKYPNLCWNLHFSELSTLLSSIQPDFHSGRIALEILGISMNIQSLYRVWAYIFGCCQENPVLAADIRSQPWI